MITTLKRIITLIPKSNFNLSLRNQITSESLNLKPFTINNLWNNPGSRKDKKRLGRGNGSGTGKTSGRG